MKQILVVEGNIGAGKSTLLSALQSHLGVEKIAEPVDAWQSIGTDNLLQKFYDDPKRWSYTFQTFAFVSRAVKQQQSTQANPAPLFVQERSVFSDRFCFAQNCYEMGLMSTLEWQLYKEWFDWLAQTLPKPTAFIYARTEPEICFARIQKRNRAEEKSITLDYLTRLHALHEQWLVQRKEVFEWLADVPVLTVSVTKEFEHDLAQQEKIINQVRSFTAGCTQTKAPAQQATDVSL